MQSADHDLSAGVSGPAEFACAATCCTVHVQWWMVPVRMSSEVMGCRRAMGKPCMPCDAWVSWSFPELRREGNPIVEAISRRQRGLFGSTGNPVGDCRLHCPRCCQRGGCGEPRRPRKSGGGPASGLSSFGRAKLLLSRASVRPVDRPARQEPRPPEGLPARREPRPPERGGRLGRSLALPGDVAALFWEGEAPAEPQFEATR